MDVRDRKENQLDLLMDWLEARRGLWAAHKAEDTEETYCTSANGVIKAKIMAGGTLRAEKSVWQKGRNTIPEEEEGFRLRLTV